MATEKPKTPASLMVPGQLTLASEKPVESPPVIPGQLTVRRLPRVDVNTLMMEGVKDMDVVWHSAADAAEALRRRPSLQKWNVATVMGAVKRATKKFIAKKAVRQQRKLLQQLAALRDDAAPVVDVQGQMMTDLPADEAVTASSQPCRTDLLKHLLLSPPLHGNNDTTYECC